MDVRTAEEQFAFNLRKARAEAGLTQEDCAFLAGMHRTQMSLYETGKVLPRTLTLVKLAATCSVTPNDLLAGIDWTPGAFQLGRMVIGGKEDS